VDQNCNQRSSAQYVELKKNDWHKFYVQMGLVLKALIKRISKELQDRQTKQAVSLL
jgi:hypothetical protein